VPKQECQNVPRQECRNVPRQSCKNVPKQNCTTFYQCPVCSQPSYQPTPTYQG
jgi:hypothetical protein